MFLVHYQTSNFPLRSSYQSTRTFFSVFFFLVFYSFFFCFLVFFSSCIAKLPSDHHSSSFFHGCRYTSMIMETLLMIMLIWGKVRCTSYLSCSLHASLNTNQMDGWRKFCWGAITILTILQGETFQVGTGFTVNCQFQMSFLYSNCVRWSDWHSRYQYSIHDKDDANENHHDNEHENIRVLHANPLQYSDNSYEAFVLQL